MYLIEFVLVKSKARFYKKKHQRCIRLIELDVCDEYKPLDFGVLNNESASKGRLAGGSELNEFIGGNDE